jgi:hypothetical protein
MPLNNCDPAPIPVNPADQRCPKCGAEMEPIERGAAGEEVQHLQLCPDCYLVLWSDPDGQLHFRQGVPMKPGVDPSREPTLTGGEPETC